MDPEQRSAHVAALIRERDGYLAGGREDRAAEVEAELDRLGEKAATAVKRAQRRTPKGKESR